MKQMNLFFLLAIVLNLTACAKDFSAIDTTTAATGVVTVITPTPTPTPTTTGDQTCQTGYGYNSLYGCLPQSTCSSGYGYYNGQCYQVITVIVGGSSNFCQAYCPAGYTATDFGCFPVHPGCPACSGLGPDGYCYWASYYLDWLYGYY